MAEHNDLGAWGERQAQLYLLEHGYQILQTNWRKSHLELDIIATRWGETVFVEVKTRSNEDFALAAEALNRSKRENMIAAAHEFLYEYRLWDFPFRYDLVTIVGSAQSFELKHYPAAFTERDY